MTDEVLLALAGIVVAVLIYFAGVHRSRRHAREDRSQREKAEQDRRLHDLRIRMVEEYAGLYAKRQDAGPHLLVRLGLPQLRTDVAIRETIAEIQLRTGHDPWEGASGVVADLDLFTFFQAAAAQNADFTRVQVAEFAEGLSKAPRGAA